MLTAQPHAMKEGQSLLVSGELFADGHWHVSVFLHQRPDGTWRVGRETDSEVYVLNHVFASVPARCGPYRAATKTERRELLKQIYEWIDEHSGTGRDGSSMSQDPPSPDKEIKPMSNMQCAIYTRYGKGPRCPKQAAIGKDICGTHFFLEAKLGALPRQPVTEVAVPATPEPVAIMRTTPDAVAEADFAVAPTEPTPEPTASVEAPTVEESKKHRKTRTKKVRKPRAKKAKETPFA
jgi:hypothetical protein